jgi:regulator of sirC expression with transglutaminase-like and TPR domain
MMDKEIKALIKLLDDPDESIYFQVKDKLLSFGPTVIPELENAWEHEGFGVLFMQRIEEIIHSIQFSSVCNNLKTWAQAGGKSLLEGILLISKYQYPDLDETPINQSLKKIEKDIWLELNDNLTAFEKVKIINHILFDIHGFSGNTTNYHAPQNSYINTVLESKKGSPLSLAIIYILVSRELKIPIYGVNLPRHFILAYLDNFGSVLPEEINNGVLFYINPFSKGAVLSRREVEHFLKQVKIEQHPSFFEPCSNVSIIKRVLNNLIYSYEKLGYKNKVTELEQMADAVNII